MIIAVGKRYANVSSFHKIQIIGVTLKSSSSRQEWDQLQSQYSTDGGDDDKRGFKHSF